MTQTEPWTILRLLNWTTGYLKDHGSETARLDAEVLLAHARGCERIDLYTAFDEVVDEQVRAAFRQSVRSRAEGTPVAYLVGHREFYSLSFRVTPDVLIPRPETELLVVEILDFCRARDAGADAPRIADVGTGSGAIAVAAAKHLPTARVTAIDISPAALDVARHNAQTHGVADRIEFHEGDLLAPVSPDLMFDVVASNPPYVTEAELAGLPVTVREHEPHLALVAGEQGTDVIERLVPAAGEHLVPGGWLMMEISPMIAHPVGEMVRRDGVFDSVRTVKDLTGHTRVVLARKA